MSKPNPLKLPWIVYTPPGSPWARICDADDNLRATRMELEDAREIVRCVNAMPAMVAEMERYRPVLQAVQDDHYEVWMREAHSRGIATINGYTNAIERAKGDR